ncbi:IclR family transcriptional regulator [Roseibium sp.]|uniref:IclR family transcriptional regulator n=1 Tax=Roseibium sp. TaxID=1936156 RepID=UPI003B501128
MSADDGSNTTKSEQRRSASIQSVSIAARFLNVLSDATGPLPLGVIAREAGTGSPTAHRYLQSLVKEGLVQQDPLSGQYDLGPAALRVGISALRRIDPVEIAARHMKDLANDHAFTAGVAIWTERGPTVVRWYRSAYFAINTISLGDVLPLDNTACGLLFQAYLSEAHTNVARKLQPAGFRDKKPSKREKQKMRETCWAELTGHLSPGITGQAVPVFDAQQELACVMTTVTNLGLMKAPEDRWALFEHAKRVAQETGGVKNFAGL